MLNTGLISNKVNMKLLKGGVIVVLLTVLFFILRNRNLLQLNYEKTPAILKKVTAAPPTAPSSVPPTVPPTAPPTTPPTAPHVPDAFCTFKPLTSADAEEERLVLDSIAWPETPPLPAPFSLDQTSDPAHSTFTILPGRGGEERHVGDQLDVIIQIYDFQGNPKKSGGDFLIARLHNRALEAGVAGRVVDHLNGSYSAAFPLLWEGSAQVEVTLVHSSEAVTVLRRLNREHPDRAIYKSLFRSGNISESTICNVCLRQTSQPQCNYTDLRTGDPWFCYKPKTLSCDARMNHMYGDFTNRHKANEAKLFRSKVNMQVFIQASGATNITVLPEKKEQSTVSQGSGTSGPSGYYYQGVWRSLGGTKVNHFNASAITRCLKGKVVHLYGDSTVRQWFEYLKASLKDAKAINWNKPTKAGPFMMFDNARSTLVTFHFHGPPISISNNITVSELHYIANEIDDVVGGPNTVVIFGIWAHLTPFPIRFYIRRLQSIRRAVIRLLNRAPDTLVFIRTPNLRGSYLRFLFIFNDWYAMQQNKAVRAVFKGLNVHLVDAWEMVLAHHLPHNIHPLPPIIKNMVNIILSHTCPQ